MDNQEKTFNYPCFSNPALQNYLTDQILNDQAQANQPNTWAANQLRSHHQYDPVQVSTITPLNLSIVAYELQTWTTRHQISAIHILQIQWLESSN